ncbi:uncharacterized protein LOC118417560 [Branchiostoma floridae]|uniref:Uncharacterized protein LOC118417560 n=1 Tax=Branchiostoma floridae TaxID=7739 RepID=A0A9J7LAK0_BRAFL|nr:uncharacterized protein LOC118417560 [Branchiostoma floridae]
MRCAVLVLLLAVLAAGSHFRGTTISWRADKSTTGLVHFSFRIAWRRSSSNSDCTQNSIVDGTLHGADENWSTQQEGALSSTRYYCTDFSVSEDWATGGNTFDYVFNDATPRIVYYGACCWINVNERGSGSWYAKTVVDLSPRSDTGQPNSSPISASAPIVRIIQQCDSIIRIPVEDPDGDAVRCRWGSGTDECGGVCGALPNVNLDEGTCTLHYTAAGGGMATGWWAIALVLEDFVRSPSCSSPPFPASCGPFTQIPLQFLAFVESSNVPCNQRPELIGQTPDDQDCIGIPPGDTYTAVIQAEAGRSGVTISEILTTSPIGLTKSSLAVDPNNPQRASVTVTWTPTAQQAGQHIFCFRAKDSFGFESSQRCVTLLAGATGNNNPPAAMLQTRTPTHQVDITQQITWSLTFDIKPELPSTPKYIRFFDDTDMEVHTIDTSSSSDVQISGNTLSFTTAPNVIGQGNHYILMDAGVVVSPANCAASGPPFVGISSRSTWTFSDTDECASGTDNCSPQASCTNTASGFTCACKAGYTGNGVSCTDINECTAGTHNCSARASCTNTDGGFNCVCNVGYSGDGITCTDIDECAADPGTANCSAQATCTNTDGSFTCACYSGYTGDGVFCLDIDECAAGTDNCSAQASCTNMPGSFTCACDFGYIGDGVNCTDIDECTAGTNNCNAQASCTNTVGSFSCVCNSGYSGDGVNCTDIDECTTGTDNCSPHASCSNTAGGFTCGCHSGYTGDGVSCADIDECANGTDNCSPQATCTNTVGGFTCACHSGYGGNGVICTEIDECANGADNCSPHASCTNTVGSYTCACRSGYMGDGVNCTGLSNLTFTDVGMDYVSLSWTAPTDLLIMGYRVRYSSTSGSHRDLHPPPSANDTTATVLGLWAQTEYTFTVTSFGVNDTKNGEISGTQMTADVEVNVVCSQDQMQLSLPRAALPGVFVDNMHLLDDTCRATVNPTEVTVQTGLQECGTFQNVSSDDKFTFINEVIARQVVYDNGAVRGTPFRKRFHCEFLRRYEVSGRQILYNIPSPRVQVVNANNSFIFEMHMYTSADFSASYNSDNFPLQVLPTDRIHYSLSVRSPLSNLELFALDCVSTPTMDPDDSPRVIIIQDGCDIDTTLTRDSARSTDMALYFSITAFTFPNAADPSLVYLHCTMVICLKDDVNSRCRQGCIPARRRRDVAGEDRVRRDSSNDVQQSVTQGPFRIVREQDAGIK